MNIKELKEYIKDLPDDMEVICNASYIYDLEPANCIIEDWKLLITDWEWNTEIEFA